MAIFVVIVCGLAWLSCHPRIFNYPRIVSEANAQEMYRPGEFMTVGVTASCALINAGILASAGTQFNGALLILPGVAVMLGALGVGLTRMFRA
ncbi:hypothetical protein JOF28_000217 [Leucobacter exalbidus]|uniref:Uncharacterized protein n=1 Tax=Leucobacter exalbidus TaxID=662960 RepID=A0A940PKU2_9MICO|nr:hypothetical protein [Leucobacter exalbidus]MBP1324985.1 hypothetical protein [Leucobacter exalbidus]